jgi:hypothetical protein
MQHAVLSDVLLGAAHSTITPPKGDVAMSLHNVAQNLQESTQFNNLDKILTIAAAHELTCPCCQRPIAAFAQPAMLPGRPDREYAHCLNPACVNFYNTQLVSFYTAGAA